MTPMQALIVVVGGAIVAFIAGVRFGKSAMVELLLHKHAVWTEELGDKSAAAERIVRWLHWYAMPTKWFDHPEEP